MQSVSSARFVTLPLTRRKHELLNELLEQFVASVNFCVQRCLEHEVTARWLTPRCLQRMEIAL
ncbi:MAG TPA: hypothetical protein EYP46_04180 [Hadesarchaea archaeon]|nr:hypothetical protein [Hadesarchaea archaeon]